MINNESTQKIVTDLIKEAMSNGIFKQAVKWDDLSIEQQKEYLRRHPKSKKRITAKPKSTAKDSLGANNISIDDNNAKTIMKLEEIKEAIGATTLSKKRNGNYVARWAFFYSNGQTEEQKVDRVVKAFPQAVIVDHDYVWKPFRGGASVANQSHFSVEFKI